MPASAPSGEVKQGMDTLYARVYRFEAISDG